MEKKWKIAIVVIFFLLVWMRLGPAIKWTQEAHERMDYWAQRGWPCENYSIDYEWSWWSLRIYRVYPECHDEEW